MSKEVEVLVNGDGRVGIMIDPMRAAPVCYRIADPSRMGFELVCDDGSRHAMRFPETARGGWQKLIDNEEMLVTEVEGSAADLSDSRIVRDEWLKPEGA